MNNIMLILKYKKIEIKNNEEFEVKFQKEVPAQLIDENKYIKIIFDYNKDFNLKKCQFGIYNGQTKWLKNLEVKQITINYDKCILICKKELK